MNRPTKPTTSEQQRGISIIELLFAVATLGTTILVVAMSDPKIPRALGD